MLFFFKIVYILISRELYGYFKVAKLKGYVSKVIDYDLFTKIRNYTSITVVLSLNFTF